MELLTSIATIAGLVVAAVALGVQVGQGWRAGRGAGSDVAKPKDDAK